VKYVHSGHGIYLAQYHIVWCTKYRRRILNPGVVSYTRKIILKIVKSLAGVTVEEMGFDDKLKDHIHLIMIIPPKFSSSDVIAQIKSQSSSQLRKKFPWLAKVYWRENIVWSPGFFLSTVGVNEKTIKNYVKFQGKQDSGQTQVNLGL
jgi:putative transposase